MKTQKEMNVSNSGKFEKSVPDNPCNYIDAIHGVMRELGCGCFVDVLKAYFTARIVLAYERGAGYMETMLTSPVLQKTLYAFKEAISHSYVEEQYANWEKLCHLLAVSRLGDDPMRFMSLFAPYVVQDWDGFIAAFWQGEKLSEGNMLLTLCMILDTPPAEEWSVDEEKLQLQYARHQALYQKIKLDYEAYKRCWKSVYFTELLDDGFIPNPRVSEAKERYTDQMLPRQDLLNDYAKLYLQEGVIAEKQATKGDRRRKTDELRAEGGRTEQDMKLEESVKSLAEIQPTDVVRTLFYQGRNDAGFECSFVLAHFRQMVQLHHRVLVINPSPDFMIAWNAKRFFCQETCFVVVDPTMAKLYAAEFAECRFIAVQDLGQEKCVFDRVLLLARDMKEKEALLSLSLLADGAEILAMIPAVFITAAQSKTLAEFRKQELGIRSIVTVPSGVTKSSPKRKILLNASRTEPTSKFVLLESRGDAGALMYSVEKDGILVPNSHLDGSLTLSDIRKAARQKPDLEESKYKAARVYRFSPELQFRYTIQEACKNRCAGRIYYAARLRPEQKHRKVGARLSPIVEKGLRRHTENEVYGALEIASLDERIVPCAKKDVLDYYKESLDKLTAKTVWYCLRPALLQKYSYKDDVAQKLFCGTNQDLATLAIGSTPEQFEEAMSSLFPGEDIPKKYWDLLNLMLNAACEAGILKSNPLTMLMIELSNRASKRQQSARNTLTKKILEEDEERKVVGRLLSPSNLEYKGQALPLVYSDGLWILGPLVMFAVPNLREALALTWQDFVPIDRQLGTWQIHVNKHLGDNGEIIAAGDRAPEANRRIPAAPILAQLLIEYKDYLTERYARTEEKLGSCPIVLQNQDQLKRTKKVKHCSLKSASDRCKEIISFAEIPSNDVYLPDVTTGGRLVDLSRYQGNLFYTNLKYHLRHYCRLTEGEMCYFLGLKAPDTFSAHYCAYDHVVLQHRVACKLTRWTCAYGVDLQRKNMPECGNCVVEGNAAWRIHGVPLKSISVNAMLMPKDQAKDLAGTLIRISSKHGMTGTIICLGKDNEDETRGN